MVRICSKRSKFFPFGGGSHLKGAEMEVEKNVSSLGVPIHHKIE